MRMIFILMAIIAFNGCSDSPTPPHQENLIDRPEPLLQVRAGCLCKESKDNAMNLIKNLRSDIEFYKNQNNTLNEKYDTSSSY